MDQRSNAGIKNSRKRLNNTDYTKLLMVIFLILHKIIEYDFKSNKKFIGRYYHGIVYYCNHCINGFN